MYIENKYWNNYIGDTDDSLSIPVRRSRYSGKVETDCPE